MSVIVAFLMRLLGGAASPVGALVFAAGLVASLGFNGVQAWRASGLREQIATLTAERDQAKVDLATTKGAFNAFEAQAERNRADANAKALAAQEALQRDIEALRSKLASDTANNAATTKRLLDALHAIPPTEQAALSAGVRDYLRRVSDAQAAGADGRAAPAGNQNH